MKRILSLFCTAAVLLSGVVLTSSCGTLNSEALLAGGMQALQAATLSDAQIKEYVGEYIAQSDKENVVLPESDPYTKRLRKLTSGITQVDGTPLNFKVYKTDQVNAFACADGSVRVYTGLMDLMTDDEVLGVIGHEIGHVGLKHTKKQFQQALLTTALRYGLVAAGGTIGALSSSQLGDLGQTLASSSFSRSQESDADDYGYEFLVKNGKNPYYMAMAFEKLESLNANAKTSNAVNNLFSTHPDTQKRISRMTARAEKDGYKRPATKSTTTTKKK
ncbi:MAG: M48 family metallopeptidase [Bacteroidales bacterium]|nr:M48 family metallopeptidase [Bacteroidales bacterium]